MTSTAVVIVNYNAGELLTEATRSAFAAGADLVVVVDNASADTSLYHLRRSLTDDRLIILENDDNLGFAAACNRGYRSTATDSLLFLNPDARLEPGALATLQGCLSAKGVGMAGPLLLNTDGSEQRGGRRRMPTPTSAFAHAFGLTFLAPLFPRMFRNFNLHGTPLPDHPVVVEALSGGCMLVSRAALDAVDGWDEGYFLHVEDLDLCQRLRECGWQLMFVPAAVAIHVKGASSKAVQLFVEKHKHRGMIRFYRKFYSQRYPHVMMLAVEASVWIRYSLIVVAHHLRSISAGKQRNAE